MARLVSRASDDTINESTDALFLQHFARRPRQLPSCPNASLQKYGGAVDPSSTL